MKMRGKSDRFICPRCPPFENREGWGSLCRGGTDKQTSSVYMSAVPTLRKPRRVGQPLSWRYRQANVISDRESARICSLNKNGPIAGAKFQEANLVGDVRKGKATYRSGDWSDRSGSGTEKE